MGMIVVETPGAAADASPESMGLPPVKGTEQTPVDSSKTLWNTLQWLVGPVTFNAMILAVAGFFIYGPQCIIGIGAANLTTKRAAAASAGIGSLLFALCWPAKAHGYE